jgi:hypothetical protein
MAMSVVMPIKYVLNLRRMANSVGCTTGPTKETSLNDSPVSLLADPLKTTLSLVVDELSFMTA